MAPHLILLSATFLFKTTSAQATGGNATQVAAATAAANKIAASNANQMFYDYIFIILASLIAGLTVWRVTLSSVSYVRKLTCLNNPTQSYFIAPNHAWASFKRSLLYAPISSKRHNKEIMLSKAINVGTLPTRFQLLFLLSYFGTNVAFCVVSIHWDQSFTTVCQELRNRTGILAVVNMIPLFIMAARNNPLLDLLCLSFDTFNLLHRWFGRVVVLQAVTHTAAWTASTVHTGGWAAVVKAITQTPYITFGLIVSVAACHVICRSLCSGLC